MKIENLAYQIAGETLHMLEVRFHYRVTEEHKKEIQEAVRDDLDGILKRAAGRRQD